MNLFIHKVYGYFSEQCTSTLGERNKPTKHKPNNHTQPPKTFALALTGV